MAKAQVVPFVFLIFLVSAILIGYIFFNAYYGTRYSLQTLQISIADAIANVAQSLKNYLLLSLAYSDQQALREHACVGGTVGAAPWIVNGPNPVSVDQSKQCLEKYTLFYFNSYEDLFNSSLPVEINKYNFTKTVYGVDSSGVLSGQYDEGYFWVNSSKGAFIVSAQNRNVTAIESLLKDDDFVSKNRYWYMFRNFYDWAMADVYSPCICSAIGCSCGSGSGEESCSSCATPVNNCAKNALKDLQSRFDENVVCSMNKLCCQQGIGDSCLDPSGCIAWDNSCAVGSQHQCLNPTYNKKVCPVKVSSLGYSGANSQQTLSSNENKITFTEYTAKTKTTSNVISFQSAPLSCTSKIWYEGRVSGGYKFTCQDFKYYVSSDKGPVPLTFTVTAYAFWKEHEACQSVVPCDCPADAKSCDDCTSTGCTKCE